MDQQNFVECGLTLFSDRVVTAAREGHLSAGPLLGVLQDFHAVTRGLEQICKIAAANRVQELAWRDRDADNPMEPPLNVNTVESLLALGEVAAKNMHSEIDRLSDWLEENAIKEPDAASDLAIAAQASVARSRPNRTAPTETREPEHA